MRSRFFLLGLCLPLGLLTGCATGGVSGDVLPTSYDGSLVVTPNPAVFPETRAGCVRTVSLDVLNTSPDLPIEITDVEPPGAALSLAEGFPIRIEPGARRSIDVHFTPEAAGRRAGELVVRTDEGRLHPLALPVEAVSVARAAPAQPAMSAGPAEPLDLVLVLDVSTTMNELAALRSALLALLESVAAAGADVRFGLTTFENDVLVHADGRFLEPEALLAELDGQLVEGTWSPNPELPRQLLNFDFQENVLDALARSAIEFEFRPGVRRYFLLMTDDTFLEPPQRFSDGTPVQYAYADVARALAERDVRLFSVHAPFSGRGLSSGHDGAPSLVEATRGAWFEIADVDRGSLSLDELLQDLAAGRTCN